MILCGNRNENNIKTRSVLEYKKVKFPGIEWEIQPEPMHQVLKISYLTNPRDKNASHAGDLLMPRP